ncbi:MAG: glycosyltransferase [Rhodoblastus sp.]|nr:glycosyltransferase [Rhodoblastus sp.]
MRLLAIHRLHHRKGGAEGVHLDHLALFRERGWDCAEFAMAHPDNEPSDWSDYFPARFEPPSGLAGLAATPRFFHSGEAREKFTRLLDDFKPDIIHAHGVYHHLTNAILKPARERGVPMVYTLHDYKLICPAYHFYTERMGVCEQCRGGRQWRCLVNRCTHGSLAMDALYALDGFIQWRVGALRNAVSRFIGPARFIVDKFAEHGFAPDKLRYIPNFFESADDAPVDPPAVAALREKYGRYVLFFGRLSAEKGVDLLIDACAQAGVPLVVVGDGPKRAELQARAAARGGAGAFLGHLKGAALWAHVEAASLVALPSVWYEIAPKSILEAQARGKPSLVTTIGGLPEMVEEGATGFLAAPSDLASLVAALGRAFALDDATLARMGALARERATTTFTRERYYGEMTALYAELSPAIAAQVAREAQPA